MASKYQQQEAAIEDAIAHAGEQTPLEKFSPVFPFGTPRDIKSINHTGYYTAQTLVQHVAYTLSDRLFTYSPESFALDDAVKQWNAAGQPNGRGTVTAVDPMETRLGAANVLLGYIFGSDAQKRQLAQTIIASSGSLTPMRSALDQLALLYNMSAPFVAHVAAVEYDAEKQRLVTDYVSAVTAAQETGAGLIGSWGVHEAQHMALFATLAATVLPTVHIYDGLRVARETAKVTDILDQSGLQSVFASVSREETVKTDKVVAVNRILKSLNAELGTAYQLFEYEGHAEPEAVLVVFGSVEASLATQVVASLAKAGEKVGVIAVRVYRPFSEEDFLAALPTSVRRVAVLGQVWDQAAVEDATVQSALFTDVAAAVTLADAWSLPPPVIDVKYPREQSWSPKQFAWIFDQIVRRDQVLLEIPEDALTVQAASADSFDLLSEDISAKQFVFWDSDEAPATPAAATIAKLLAKDENRAVTFNAVYDNVPIAGTLQSQIRTSRKAVDAPFPVEGADVAYVGDVQLLKKFDVAGGIKNNGAVIVKGAAPEDFTKTFPAVFRRALAKKGISFLLLDTANLDENTENALVQLAFLQVAGLSNEIQYTALVDANKDEDAVAKAKEALEKALVIAAVEKEWAEEVVEEEFAALPRTAHPNSFTLNIEKHVEEPASILKSWESAATALCFKEAYSVEQQLRPDLSMKNFIVKVKERKRVTPLDYDRDIFHIEFDLTGTGLKYDIGEALGIHQQNDPTEVEEFIAWYGARANDIVHVPSRENPDVLEARTLFQALSQNVDIFGRPPKKFYEALSEYATDETEKKSLLALAGPEGATEFKRRAEVDNVTYADILTENPSAHPPITELVKIVAPLKRREYSIASSQKVHPNEVHLLIVAVEWKDPRGRTRFGQATRYLNRLNIGDEVVVSVKPSVMRLPPSTEAPLIMAGLGTGLAPFRAFIQHRAWQKSQGLPIGPVMLYLGSRHQKQEYLYGEEWEAYIDAGIITHMGAAFSRDQKEKIYIQDRMRQSLEEIRVNYLDKEGAFYLCGPTWPVPDVAAVLEEAIKRDAELKGKKVEVGRELEVLREKGRYILEVY